MHQLGKFLPLLSALGMTLVSVSSFAAESTDDEVRLAGQDHASVSLGTYGRQRSTSLKVNATGVAGTNIDLNKRFGFGRRIDSGRIDLSYRFGRKDRTELSYYRASQANSLTLDQDVTIGGVTFDQGAGVRASQTVEELQWRWKRAIWLEKNYDVGFSLGTHTLALKYDVSTTSGQSKSRKVNAVLPLPLLGVYGEYYFSPQWSVLGSFEILALEIGSYSGRVTDIKFGVDYSVNERFSLGLGYASFQAKVGAHTSDFDGELGQNYYGARIYGTYRF